MVNTLLFGVSSSFQNLSNDTNGDLSNDTMVMNLYIVCYGGYDEDGFWRVNVYVVLENDICITCGFRCYVCGKIPLDPHLKTSLFHCLPESVPTCHSWPSIHLRENLKGRETIYF